MKPSILRLTCLLFFSGAILSSAYGADCTGPWQTIPNFKKSMGPACKALGLDSQKGTCEPGHAYETLCDDMAVGKYRTCQGPRPCTNILPGGRDCRQWDFEYNRPCPEGYVNTDCQGHCEQLFDDRKCRHWDFNYNTPCPEGYINYDCKGGCEPASRFLR